MCISPYVFSVERHLSVCLFVCHDLVLCRNDDILSVRYSVIADARRSCRSLGRITNSSLAHVIKYGLYIGTSLFLDKRDVACRNIYHGVCQR